MLKSQPWQGERTEVVEITRPIGQRQAFHDVEADKFYLIEKGGRVRDARWFRMTAVR